MRAAPARGALVGLVVLLLAALALFAALREPAPPVASAWPTPQELDSLSRYLEPAAAAPPIDEYAAYLPAGIPAYREPAAVAPAPVVDETVWRVSAILITRNRPVAIINDEQVRPGERLAGGAEVVAIENDHVIIRVADGTRRTLRLTPGAQ